MAIIDVVCIALCTYHWKKGGVSFAYQTMELFREYGFDNSNKKFMEKSSLFPINFHNVGIAVYFVTGNMKYSQ